MSTKRKGLKIANLADGKPDPSIMNYPTEKGFFLDGQGNAYMQSGGKFLMQANTTLTYMDYLCHLLKEKV